MSMQQKSANKILIGAGCILMFIIFITAGFRMVSYVFSRAAGNFFYPYLKLSGGTTGEIRDKSLLSLDRMSLVRQIEKLTERNRELALRSTAASGILAENRDLRRKLDLKNLPEWNFCTGEIILRDPLHFREGFTIDRGSRDGISPGDAVVDTMTDGRLFLIGVVSDCSARTARVATIADPALKISGKIRLRIYDKNDNSEKHLDVVGFTNSGDARTGSAEIRFGMLPVSNSYIPGEAVMTTGYERKIPEGIKIGELVMNLNDQQVLSGNVPDFNCALRPAVRFEELRFVTVVSRQDNIIK